MKGMLYVHDDSNFNYKQVQRNMMCMYYNE